MYIHVYRHPIQALMVNVLIMFDKILRGKTRVLPSW